MPAPSTKSGWAPDRRLRVVEVDEHRLPQNPSEAQIRAGIEAEGREILSRIPAGSYLIPLCIEGKQLTSEEFSQTLDRAAVDGKSSIVLLIGGSVRAVGRTQEKGRPAPFHVPDDLSASAGPGDGAGAALSGHDNFTRAKIP